MAVTLQERGRGKFKSAPDYDVEEVKELLMKKLKKRERNLWIVVRELILARIQIFPDWYKFGRGTKNRKKNAKLDLVYKQIRNVVPVRLAFVIAEPIAKWVKSQLEQIEVV